jgi:fructokinase
LVTRGADPTSVLTPTASELLAVARAPGPVVDTIGAGDTFCGALLAHLDSAAVGAGELRGPGGHEHLIAAVRTALVAASIVVTRRGADPPLAAEVDMLRD